MARRRRSRKAQNPITILLRLIAAVVLIGAAAFAGDAFGVGVDDILEWLGIEISAGDFPDPAASPMDGQVLRVIDGDTIAVSLNGQEVNVRYLGINTPERGETCYAEAREANRRLVEGTTVRLVADEENTDQYDRLLRYIYVGDVFVNAELVEAGYAEVVLYPPNDAQFTLLRNLEVAAADAGRGCHPTGIFNDNTFER